MESTVLGAIATAIEDDSELLAGLIALLAVLVVILVVVMITCFILCVCGLWYQNEKRWVSIKKMMHVFMCILSLSLMQIITLSLRNGSHNITKLYYFKHR